MCLTLLSSISKITQYLPPFIIATKGYANSISPVTIPATMAIIFKKTRIAVPKPSLRLKKKTKKAGANAAKSSTFQIVITRVGFFHIFISYTHRRIPSTPMLKPGLTSWMSVSYTHLRAHETRHDLVCRLLLEKKKQKK